MARIEGTRVADGRYLPLIVVSVIVRLPDGESTNTDALALVDSGADRSAIPAELLEGSGITFDDLPVSDQKGHGLGGSVEVRTVQGQLLYEDVPFVDGAIEVIAPEALPGPVLGRADFMSVFRVAFDWRKDPPRMHIRPYDIPNA